MSAGSLSSASLKAELSPLYDFVVDDVCSGDGVESLKTDAVAENERPRPLSLYVEWCSALKIELKHKSAVNVEQRMSKITRIVNEVVSACCSEDGLSPSRVALFAVSEVDLSSLTERIDAQIDSWRGVEIEVCKNREKKSFGAYQATARNWFNRNKAKIYGNHLFYDLIFRHILKVHTHSLIHSVSVWR